MVKKRHAARRRLRMVAQEMLPFVVFVLASYRNNKRLR